MPRTIEFSGNRSIDGVLSGVAWDENHLFFSFPQSADVFPGDYANGEPETFQPVNQVQQAAYMYALYHVSSYTNLTFEQMAETTTEHANLRFSMSSKWPTAVGYYPTGNPSDGDIWMNPEGGPTFLTPDIGNWGLSTTMHELGHTLGLKHGHQAEAVNGTPGALPTSQDCWNYSLMTYRSYVGADTNFSHGLSESDNPTTYMQSDIAALQYMYGANFNTNAGNTVYKWSPTTGAFMVDGTNFGVPANNKILMTLWDGNGIDTYDLSAYRTGVVINLQPGAFSTFSTAQLADLDGSAAYRPAAGNVANARLYEGDLRSLIERALGGSGNDRITGNVARNLLVGNGGNDILNGATGADDMRGGTGNDTYYVDNTGDRITETSTGGTDTIYSTITYRLGSYLENLKASGTVAVALTGNTLANTIYGNGGSNKINGLLGKDILAGGSGRDIFIFSTRPSTSNFDKVTDYNVSSDSIQLDNAVFTRLGGGSPTSPKGLNKAFLRLGTKALDSNDFLIYDRSTGTLSYDADGSGGGGAIKIAQFSNKPALTGGEFFVI